MKTSTGLWAGLGVSLVIAAVLLAQTAVVAEQKRSIDEDHPGYLSYRKYCASCHGVFADGKGPVAPLLTTRPADLTRLGAKFGTPIPKDQLAAFIDGRTAVGSHGPREMPVWGEQLYDEMPARERELADWARSVLIERIVEYLIAIQRTD